jgi:hypothetical protein
MNEMLERIDLIQQKMHQLQVTLIDAIEELDQSDADTIKFRKSTVSRWRELKRGDFITVFHSKTNAIVTMGEWRYIATLGSYVYGYREEKNA